MDGNGNIKNTSNLHRFVDESNMIVDTCQKLWRNLREIRLPFDLLKPRNQNIIAKKYSKSLDILEAQPGSDDDVEEKADPDF